MYGLAVIVSVTIPLLCLLFLTVSAVDCVCLFVDGADVIVAQCYSRDYDCVCLFVDGADVIVAQCYSRDYVRVCSSPLLRIVALFVISVVCILFYFLFFMIQNLRYGVIFKKWQLSDHALLLFCQKPIGEKGHVCFVLESENRVAYVVDMCCVCVCVCACMCDTFFMYVFEF